MKKEQEKKFNVKIPCFECGSPLKFHIENEIVLYGDGRIVCNIPGAVCPNCIDLVLDKVPDPPGLVCFNELTPTLARDLILNSEFLLSSSQAVNFFLLLFPGSELIYLAGEQRLHGEGHKEQAGSVIKKGLSKSESRDGLR